MQSPKKDACQILPYSKEAPIQCLPQPASLVKRLYFSMHLTAVIASNHCYTPPRLSVASHLPCSQITFAHLSRQPVARCSCTAFKLKAESECTHKKEEKKKSESKHIQKVHAEPYFLHCAVSNTHHSKFKPDFQEPRPQWFLL